LGPWAGVVAMTLTVALQAFLFGDGGVTAIGANAFNMAFVMPFAGYYSHRLLAAGQPCRVRAFVALFAAGFIAVNAAALAVALELGVQPLIAAGLDGRPLYAPYPLSITIPAMMLPHLFFFGQVEGLGTALVVSYVYKTGVGGVKTPGQKALRPLWAVIIVLIIAAPFGLLASGSPWGEWAKEEFVGLVGYLPAGMDSLALRWRGVMPGYGAPAGGGSGQALFYILSAALGSAAVVFVVYLWGRLWRR
ncbi:MAG: energy-coupling factor ABC transporter permease, partial [Deltaproteobacteria bacterium]|nr:energy-coupling factor ABC transporter permease [Deltaproteobacteria bacterium]